MGDDGNPEVGGHRIEGRGGVFADANRLKADEVGRRHRFGHLLDQLQVRRDVLSRPPRTGGGSASALGLTGAQSGPQFAEHEGRLFGLGRVDPQPLRVLPELARGSLATATRDTAP